MGCPRGPRPKRRRRPLPGRATFPRPSLGFAQLSRENEKRISQLLSKRLRVEFTGKRLTTRYGQVDDYVYVRPNRLLLLEVEESQNHPATNVLKLWPLLQDRPKLRIVLAQTFLPTSRGITGSRRLLNDWIAATMIARYPRRFRYCRVEVSKDHRRANGIEPIRLAVRDCLEYPG